MYEEMARMPKGNYKRLVLIRPPQLQFFKDSIKTTETETAAINMHVIFVSICACLVAVPVWILIKFVTRLL